MPDLLPVLITVPHASAEAPPEILARMLAGGEPEDALRRRLLNEGDPLTDRIYDLPAAAVVRAPWSRFVVDLNRGRGETGPDGVIKPADFRLRSWYARGYVVDAEERERRLRLYYDPFHAQVEKALSAGGVRFLLDGHSMTPEGPPLGPDLGRRRPAVCIGNLGGKEGEPVSGRPVSLEPSLARALRDEADRLVERLFPGWPPEHRARLNDPFDGGWIVERYAGSGPGQVPGILCEFNRALYWNEDAAEELPGSIARLRELAAGLLRFILPRLSAS